MSAVGDVVTPRAFISHASEDKDRFVVEFATRLLAAGVDAWVDQWELRAGDSLVQRIFENGIADADAFVVVLSDVSVSKPWVREELDAGVVRRIESLRSVRLIPIILDDDVEIPAALRHLLRLSVPRLGLEGVVSEVTNALFEIATKPPVGEPPTFSRYRSAGAVKDPIDDVVFTLIVEEWRLHGLNTVLRSNGVQATAASLGIDAGRFAESMHALIGARVIDAQAFAGNRSWRLKSVPDQVWLSLEAQRGVDIAGFRRRVLSEVVNDGVLRFDPSELGVHGFTLRAVLRDLERDGLLVARQVLDGTFLISNVSPLARRELRQDSGE